MALFDFLKRKKQIDKAKEKGKTKKPENKTDEVLLAKEDKKEQEEKKQYRGADHSTKKKGFSYGIIQEPHISEKSTNLGKENKYIFKVYKNANKPEIKKAVEGIYGVDVLSVNVIKIPKKKRRLGRTKGFRKGYTKAVVMVKEGQKIEIF